MRFLQPLWRRIRYFLFEDPLRSLGLGIALAISAIFILGNAKACGGELWGILDDVYIHFQYAKSIALGSPFAYSPGDVPSSGGTSFLYPFLLAPGWLIGFREWTLMIWALFLGLLGLLAGWYFYYQSLREELSRTAAVFFFLIMLPAGATYATILGGMEGALLMAGLAIAIRHGLRWQTLGLKRDFLIFTIAVALVPLARPEGAVLWGFYYLVVLRHAFLRHQRPGWWLVPLPLLTYAAFIGLCHLVYGSSTLNSVMVKSWFTDPNWNFAAAWQETINTWKTFLRAVPGMPDSWAGLAANFSGPTGSYSIEQAARGGEDYMPHIARRLWWLSALGIFGLILRDLKQKRVGLGVVCVLLFLGTLPPSATYSFYWGAYRYYVPFFVLFYIGAAAALYGLWRFPLFFVRWLLKPVVLLLLFYFAQTAYTSQEFFQSYYAKSAHNIQTQQGAAGRYLRANTPPEAVIGMNDAGAIAYFSERRTYDYVGLTTQGRGRAWREGKGSVFELIERLPRSLRPSYWALYPHWLNMGELLGDRLQTFTSPSKDGVGSVTHEVFKAAPLAYDFCDRPHDTGVPKNMHLIGELDAGDAINERAVKHRVLDGKSGLEFYAASLYERLPTSDRSLSITEGGRLVPAGAREEFELTLRPKRAALLVARMDGRRAQSFHLSLNGQVLAKEALVKGQQGWEESVLPIPAEAVAGGPTRLALSAAAGELRSFHYWIYQAD